MDALSEFGYKPAFRKTLEKGPSMKRISHTLCLALALLAAGLAAPRAVRAQAADTMSAAKGDIKAGAAEDFDLTKNEFRHETKVGAVFSTGNTNSFTADGTSFTLYRIKRWENKWRLGIYFNRVDSNVANPTVVGTIANYIYGFYRLDYYFLPRTTVFLGGGGYVDEIKGIDLAWNAFVGVSHFWLRSPTYSLNTSLGYDFTTENRVSPSPSVDIHAILLGINYNQQFKSYLGFTQNVLLLENAVHGEDLRINSDTELKVTLTRHFGLVLGFHIRFDNDPVPGFEKLDTITDVSLAVSFGGPAAKSCP